MGRDETPEALARGYPQYPKERFAQLFDEALVRTVRIPRPFMMARTEVTMARWPSREEGRVYRLPTEAEWEYAAQPASRAGSCAMSVKTCATPTSRKASGLLWPLSRGR